MHSHHHANYPVYLIGTLMSMPIITDKNPKKSIIVIQKYTNNRINSCRVILNNNDKNRLLKFGFLGMMLTIHGDLCTNSEAEVIAEVIDFSDSSSSNQSEITSNKKKLTKIPQKEMSYWFLRDGSLREELTYIH